MQLLRSNELPPIQGDQVFAYSRLRASSGALLLSAASCGLVIFAHRTGAWPAYFIGVFALVCLLIFQKIVTARFRPANWLMRMTDNGLFIKFRSYLNDNFPDSDFTVVFIPYLEIASAKLVKDRQETPDRDSRNPRATTTRTRRFIELELVGKSESLTDALAHETSRVFSKAAQGGANVSTRYQHLPVTLSGNFLRIEWGVVPSARVLLDALTRHTLVRPDGQRTKDYSNLESLDRKEQEGRLLELAESGDIIGAVTIARRLYSYDLTAAKQFVDELLTAKAKTR